MIPKIIHYCWFGGNPLSELAEKCIESWKKFCPDYEIKEWNESNFDINYCAYVSEAYEEKKWAFVSDVARLYALVNEGGIYMDTDVEVIESLDSLLQYHAVSGFETDTAISTGLMGCEKDNPMFKELLNEYNHIHFRLQDGSLDTTTNVVRITNSCLNYGIMLNNTKQTINTFTLLPKDYLCPKDHITGEIHLTNNTLTIHHFNGSWLSDKEKFQAELTRKYYKKFSFLSQNKISIICEFFAIAKYYGIGEAIKTFYKWIRKKLL